MIRFGISRPRGAWLQREASQNLPDRTTHPNHSQPCMIRRDRYVGAGERGRMFSQRVAKAWVVGRITQHNVNAVLVNRNKEACLTHLAREIGARSSGRMGLPSSVDRQEGTRGQLSARPGRGCLSWYSNEQLYTRFRVEDMLMPLFCIGER